MTDEELIELLRRMSPHLDMLDCENVLQAADRIEGLVMERDLWSETAAMHLSAEQAFLSWLRAAGEYMRDEGVTICDDGVDSGEILSAKVVECAGLLKSRAEAAEVKLAKAVKTLHWVVSAKGLTDPLEYGYDAIKNARTVLAELEKTE